jgi:hypothetical protein
MKKTKKYINIKEKFLTKYLLTTLLVILENKVNNCKTNNNLGKSKSLTHIKNISKGKYGVYKKGKTILQYNLKGDFIKEWESIKLSSKTLNIPRSSISSNLNQRYKSAGGYIWKYKE